MLFTFMNLCAQVKIRMFYKKRLSIYCNCFSLNNPSVQQKDKKKTIIKHNFINHDKIEVHLKK